MAEQEWTPAIGLRNAALSLIWRSAVAAGLWCGALWLFHAAIEAIGLTKLPALIALGFAALAGTMLGMVTSRGLDERAGFVSPILTLLAAGFAALAIIGSEALLAGVAPLGSDHVRFLIVGTTTVVALAWIVKNTLIES